MVARGHNPGMLILDDFICDAIPAPTITGSAGTGRNRGIHMLPETIDEAGADPQPTEWEKSLKQEAERLAAVLSRTPDPVVQSARFQQFLLDELAILRRSTGT
jgi:hypothetical protein